MKFQKPFLGLSLTPLLFILGCSSPTTTADSKPEGKPFLESGQIVYQARGIAVADASGKFLKQLPYKAAFDEHPGVSSSGEMAFTEPEAKGSSICLVTSADGKPTQLTEGHFDSHPVFAPNDALYFCRAEKKDGVANLCRLAIKDGKVDNLGHGFDDREPAVSTDGKLLVFCRAKVVKGSIDRVHAHLTLMHADGAALQDITPKGISNISSPCWSTKGDKIFFAGRRNQLRAAIFMIRPSSPAMVVRLTNDPDYDNFSPSCSPDDSSIIFVQSPAEMGVPHIAQIKAQGSVSQTLITEPDPEPRSGVGYPCYVK